MQVDDVITQSSFDNLLAAFDPDREQAGNKYEQLRLRLIKFFEWRGCDTPDELTDICFDRVLKKIAEGEQIQNIYAYSATVAQFVFKEQFRRPAYKTDSLEDIAEIGAITETVGFSGDGEGDERLFCLEKCLGQFSDENRRVITAYYDTDERTMIASRKRLADSLAVSINTLRIRVCRLKTKLEECTKDCCGSGG